MRVRIFIGLGTAFQLLSSTQAYLTTVEISLNYCPAPTSTLATGTGTTGSTSGPSGPYFLYVQQAVQKRAPGPVQYVSANGTLVLDPAYAQTFTISPSGQLMTGQTLISTSGLVPFEDFVSRPYTAAISTTFSNQNNLLVWASPSFAMGLAQFCVMGTILEAAYDGYLPAGCSVVTINVEAAFAMHSVISTQAIFTLSTSSMAIGSGTVVGSTPTPTPSASGSVHGILAIGEPVGCLMSPSSAPALSGISERTTTLEQCGDYCASYSYFGVQNGDQCVCANTLGTNASPASYGACNIPCSGNNAEICGGATVMAVYTIVSRTVTAPASVSTPASSMAASYTTTISLFPSPTSTGVPNCYDRSPFDGTINGGYLILCDTDLIGYDLESYDGTNIAECIAACRSYVPSGPVHCVAVQFDVQAEYDACTLKTNIGTINRGDNQFAQAAIIVNEPYAPSISFVDQSNPTSIPGIFSPMGITSSIATPSTVQSSSLPIDATSSSAMVQTSNPGPPSSSPPSSNIVFSSSSVQPSSSLFITSTSSTSIVGTSTLSSSTTSSATGCLAQPIGTLCPAYSGKTVNQAGSCYDIECTAALAGNFLPGNSSTANSLSNCNGFCNLYNLALPFGCVGVNYLNTVLGQVNCLLLSSITGLVYTPGTDSGSLIYAGYVSRAVSGPPTPSSSSFSVASLAPASPTLSITSSISPLLSPTSSITRSSSISISPSISSSSSSSSSVSSSVSSSALLSLTVTSTTSSISSSSTSAAATCLTSFAAGPTMNSLCSPTNYTGQGLSYNSYGTAENYEIECGTVFTGTSLSASVAFDLPDCIKACQYVNFLNGPAICRAVIFNNTKPTQPPYNVNNCYPFSTVTGATRGSTIFDGARLLYSGYPCIVDYNPGYKFS